MKIDVKSYDDDKYNDDDNYNEMNLRRGRNGGDGQKPPALGQGGL